MPDHGYQTGDKILIGGATEAAYNGLFTITVGSSSQFTYTTLTAPNANAAGNLTANKAVGAITYSTTTATVTMKGHGFATGDTVRITGASPAAYNGSFVVTRIDNDQFSYTMASNPGSNASGTVMAARGLRGTLTYHRQTSGGVTVVVVASEKRFKDAAGTQAVTTTHTYTWDGIRMLSHEVQLPIASTSHNGSGVADKDLTFFDSFGRPHWFKDAKGAIHYTEFDAATGAVLKFITDVDTDTTADFSNLPTGWSSPSGLHIKGTTEVNGFGRTTKVTDPNGNVTYTVYNDVAHEVRTYRGWNAGTNLPTGPTEVVRQDRQGLYTEFLTMTATPSLTSSKPNGTEAISGVLSLSRTHVNALGQTTKSDAFFSLPSYSTSATLGTQDTHYARTEYGYDTLGHGDRVASPTGTITRSVYDVHGRVTSTWIGTDDTPTSGSWSPSNTAGTNLVKVSENQYDVDGNLTKVTLYPGGGADARVSEMYYDWRGRLVATKSGVQVSEGTSVQRQIFYTDYDNLNRPTAQYQYDGDNVTIVDADNDGVPDKPSASLLRAKTTTEYDDQDRPFRISVYSVNETTGAVSANALKTQMWYDANGNVIKVSAPGGLVTKYVYDGAGRVTKAYYGDGGGDTVYGDADDVTGDNVLEQHETQYDANGNAIFSIARQRFHDETDTGELGNPGSTGSTPKARVYYGEYYYDSLNRLTGSADLGTNGGTSLSSRPDSSIPTRSDTKLVTSYTYDSAGLIQDVTDPRGIVTRTLYDALGRTIYTVENYIDFNPSGETGTGGGAAHDQDRVTKYTYDSSSQVTAQTALDTKGDGSTTTGDNQVTSYIYDVTVAGTNQIASKNILGEIRYPDLDGDGTNDEKVVFTYNALGDTLTKTDRNGTVHTYSYDVLGRLINDEVTTLGTYGSSISVDGAVRRLSFTYDTAGRPFEFTSHSATSGGSVVNQVRREYNGLGQLTKEYQATGGSVNTSTSPKTQYTYSEMSGGANHSRLTKMTYPNGREVTYSYTDGIDDRISRTSEASPWNYIDDIEGPMEPFAYKYLGLSTVVERTTPFHWIGSTSELKLSHVTTADASGDIYGGLDRFGNIIDHKWTFLDDSIPSTTTLAHYSYAYDRNGNRLYKKDNVSAPRSELYHKNSTTSGDNNTAYDGLNRLTGFARGTLSASGNNGSVLDTVADSSVATSWDLDALGNWDGRTSVDSTTTPTTGVTAHTLGTLRNNFSGWVGAEILVGSDDITITHLGRYVLSGNSGTHTVKLVNATTGQDVPGASVSVNTSGATAGQYLYVELGTPVTLEAGQSYYIVSQESNGGDQWYDSDTSITTSADVSVSNVVYSDSGWVEGGGGTAGKSYGPSSFKYVKATERVHNEQNQIESVGGTSLAYDNEGSLVTKGTRVFNYDAWNRLVKVTDGAYVIDQMSYDALGRRVTKEISNVTGRNGKQHFFHDGDRMIETRNDSGQMLQQQLWGQQYIDELIMVSLNMDPQNATSGVTTENLAERHFWAVTDANFNVMGLVSEWGELAERYEYDPYGNRTVYSHGYLVADLNGDGVIDGVDFTVMDFENADPDTPAWSRADLDGDGDVDDDDLDILDAAYLAGQSLPQNDPLVTTSTSDGKSFRGPLVGGATSTIGINPFGHQGLMHDEETGTLTYNRGRMGDTDLGRFLQQDREHYIDGMSLYQYVGNSPLNWVDPWGTDRINAVVGPDGTVNVEYIDEGTFSNSPPLHLGTVDPTTGYVRMLNGRYATMGQLRRHSDSWSTDWFTFIQNSTFDSDPAANDKQSIAGGIVRWVGQADELGCGDLYDLDRMLEGTEVAASMVQDLLLYYATAPLELAQAAKTIQALKQANGVRYADDSMRALRVSSGFGARAEYGSVVQKVGPGGDKVSLLKSLTLKNSREYALVRLTNGTLAVVEGGADGITFVQKGNCLFVRDGTKLEQVKRIVAHTHPLGATAAPSPGDLKAIRIIGQSKSYIFDLKGNVQRIP